MAKLSDLERVCFKCDEINILKEGEDANGRACDGCGQHGTLVTFREFHMMQDGKKQ